MARFNRGAAAASPLEASTCQALAVGFQRFERWRRRLGERRRVLFDRRERFADSRPECDWQSDSGRSGRLLSWRLAPAPHRGRLQCDSSWRAAPGRTGFRGWQSILRGPQRWRFARRLLERPSESAAHPPAGPSERSTRWMRSSEMRLRKGDCSSWIANPCRSVPSNTGSPVEFVKSARTIVSLSVSCGRGGESRSSPPPSSASTTAAAVAIIFQRMRRSVRLRVRPGAGRHRDPNLRRASGAGGRRECPTRAGSAGRDLSRGTCR